MYLYNTTFAVDIQVEDDLINWLKKDFIPSAVDEKYFIISPELKPAILRVLGGEPGISSLAVHLYTDCIQNIEDWYSDHGSALFSDVIDRWQGRVVFFSTTLECLYGC